MQKNQYIYTVAMNLRDPGHQYTVLTQQNCFALNSYKAITFQVLPCMKGRHKQKR